MPYDKGCHTVFHHRYHLVWITKYRYKVLNSPLTKSALDASGLV